MESVNREFGGGAAATAPRPSKMRISVVLRIPDRLLFLGRPIVELVLVPVIPLKGHSDLLELLEAEGFGDSPVRHGLTAERPLQII